MAIRAPSQELNEEGRGLLEEEQKEFLDLEVDDSNSDFDALKEQSTSSQIRTFWGKVPGHTYIASAAFFMVPSFLQGPEARARIRPEKLSPTAYLDGMRGLAAFIVFIFHFVFKNYYPYYSWGCQGAHYNILYLPIIRLFYTGSPAVCLFFAISGYALAYRPLKLLRNGSMGDFSTALSSLAFRRYLRLYMPIAVSTGIIAFLVQVGAYEPTRAYSQNKKYLKNFREPHPAQFDHFWEQIWLWMQSQYKLVAVFNQDSKAPRYDLHLWTIPAEFRCSLYLFLIILGTARLRTRFRFLVVAMAALYTYSHSRFDFLLFLAGMVIAENDLIRGAHVSAPALPIEEAPASKQRKMAWFCFWTLSSLFGMFLMSMPDVAPEETPGFVFLTSLVPDWWHMAKIRYWHTAGSILLLASVAHLPFYQRFFNSAVIQYLGKLSYAIYIVHAGVIHTAGYAFEEWVFSFTGTQGNWFHVACTISGCFCVPFTVWIADMFWRGVDTNCVKFAKYVETKFLKKEE